MRILLHALGAMIVAALLTLIFMSAVNVRNMIWPLLAYCFVTTWALLTIGVQYVTRKNDDSDVY